MKASHAKVASLPTRDDDVAPGSSVRSEEAGVMSGEKSAARTERTTRKPRIGHAIAAITRVRGSRKVCGAKLASRVLLCGALFRLRLLRGGDGG